MDEKEEYSPVVPGKWPSSLGDSLHQRAIEEHVLDFTGQLFAPIPGRPVSESEVEKLERQISNLHGMLRDRFDEIEQRISDLERIITQPEGAIRFLDVDGRKGRMAEDESDCSHRFPDGTRCRLPDHSAPGLAEVHGMPTEETT